MTALRKYFQNSKLLSIYRRAACPQFGLPPEQNWQEDWSGVEDEDCLFLNVWRPATEGANRTVMVWVHGGAFEVSVLLEAKMKFVIIKMILL